MLTVEKIKKQTQEEIRKAGERICPEIGVRVHHARRAYQCDCSTCRQAGKDMGKAHRRFRKAQAVESDAQGDWQAARSSRVQAMAKRGGSARISHATGGRFRSRDALEAARERFREVAGPDPDSVTWPEYLDRCLRREGVAR